jgi:hypothetical protein
MALRLTTAKDSRTVSAVDHSLLEKVGTIPIRIRIRMCLSTATCVHEENFV